MTPLLARSIAEQRSRCTAAVVQLGGGSRVYGLARTVTCALVSAAGRRCIDAIPIPAITNEMGHFQAAFASVVQTYGPLFQMVTYDAGALSEANGAAVVAAGRDYLFTLKDEHRTMLKLATELVDPHEVAAHSTDVLENDVRFFVSSRAPELLTPELWLYVVRAHWGVENQNP
jgi:hypothetical protein